jgi:hypothetical protein
LIDTRYFYIGNNDRNKYIPVKDLFFNLSFEEEVLLNKRNFSFINTKNNKKIELNLEYIEDEKYNSETDQYEKFLNKKKG